MTKAINKLIEDNKRQIIKLQKQGNSNADITDWLARLSPTPIDEFDKALIQAILDRGLE